MLIDNSWRETWTKVEDTTPLDLTLEKSHQGQVGIATFSAGIYPACSEHGAMNKVAKEGEVWRCLNCNIGADFSTYTFPFLKKELGY